MPFWRRKDPENPDTARSLREAAGLSRDELADRWGVGPVEVSAWESGAIAIPPMLTDGLRYAIAVDAHARSAEKAGVAPCSWREENEDRLATAEGFVRRRVGRAELLRHQAGCPECRALRAFERDEPPPELANPGWGSVGLWLHAVRDRFPRWMPPALNLVGSGMGILAVILVLSAFKWLVGDPADPEGLAVFLAVLAVLRIIFAVGDRAVRGMWDRAPSLAGAILVVITILPFGTLITIATDAFDAAALAMWMLVAAIVGAFMGWHGSQPPADVPDLSDDRVRFVPHSRAASVFESLGRPRAAEAVPRREPDAAEPGAN